MRSAASRPAGVEAALSDAGFEVPVDPVDRSSPPSGPCSTAGRRRGRVATARSRASTDALGTAATVQAMVFGNLGARSGTGRGVHPRSRHRRRRASWATSCRRPRARTSSPGDHATLPARPTCGLVARPVRRARAGRRQLLEQTLADMVDLEFTVEDGRSGCCRPGRAKRSPIATFRCAIDMAEDPDVPRRPRRGRRRCERYLGPTRRPSTRTDAGAPTPGGPRSIATGLAGVAGPGQRRAVHRSRRGGPAPGRGHDVVLVRRETSPADVHGMAAAVGLFTPARRARQPRRRRGARLGAPGGGRRQRGRPHRRGLEGPGGFAAGRRRGHRRRRRRHPLASAAPHCGGQPAPEVLVIERWARRARRVRRSSADAAGRTGSRDRTCSQLLHALRIKGMADAPDAGRR